MIHQDIKKMLAQEGGGFTLVELIITCTLVGILSSIAIVHLSPALDKEKLKSTTRMIENWINMQRTMAMQHGLTCEIQFDEISNTIISQIAQSVPPKSCNPSSNNPSILDINGSLTSNKITSLLSIKSTKTDPSKPAGIRFSFRGFSENFNLDAINLFEIVVSHKGLKTERCIKIASPIGLIRDGYKSNQSSPCIYNKPF